MDDIPEFSDSPYVTVNDNIPYFTKDDLTTEAFETYSELDDLGRCGVAYANVCQELMPTEDRGEIGQVKPTGWHTVKYDFIRRQVPVQPLPTCWGISSQRRMPTNRTSSQAPDTSM